MCAMTEFDAECVRGIVVRIRGIVAAELTTGVDGLSQREFDRILRAVTKTLQDGLTEALAVED